MSAFRVLLLVAVAALIAGCASTSEKAAAPNLASANISGIWHLVADTPQGRFDATMRVTQSGNEISGRLESEVGDVTYSGSVDANRIQFGHPVGDGTNRFAYTGTMEANAMSGKAVFGQFGEGSWTATRVKNQ